jgi:hypothetical protein
VWRYASTVLVHRYLARVNLHTVEDIRDLVREDPDRSVEVIGDDVSACHEHNNRTRNMAQRREDAVSTDLHLHNGLVR